MSAREATKNSREHNSHLRVSRLHPPRPPGIVDGACFVSRSAHRKQELRDLLNFIIDHEICEQTDASGSTDVVAVVRIVPRNLTPCSDCPLG